MDGRNYKTIRLKNSRMAITITDQPTSFAKVGQKLMIVATSTNVAQPNFRYVVRIYNTYTSELRKSTERTADRE